MLVSAAEMLKKAKAGHYAVGQFNINNLEWTRRLFLPKKNASLLLSWAFLKALEIYVRFQN